MKKLFYIIFLLFLTISFDSYAQVDDKSGTEKKGKKKAILAIPAKEVKKPKVLNNDATDGFKKAYDKQKKQETKKQKEQDLKNKGILTSAKIAEERFLKSWNKINAPYPVIDQDLGSFRTQSKSVKVVCRDFQYPDGDRVTILINDIPVIKNLTLKRAYQGFDIPLEVGLNKISFIALNQGSSGPNTAAFKVYDENGKVISANEWNLATGAKAVILIAKDK
ncbi:hypothetical protein AAON49_11230 [Pseudotenacibaculum sp. MALMAid0570]|uniref:hypothetical protein n=1 Tax=Pseudotenacibaculum sp. MALMAid0570 TaxID=3143938 RepID=UPI0032DF9478